MGSLAVVFPLPFREQTAQFDPGVEGRPPVELVGIGAVTPFHLPVDLWAAGRDALVLDPEVVQMPGEVTPELRTVVRLDPLDGHGETPAQLVNEVDCRPDGVVIVKLEDAIAGRLIDGGELVKATGRELQVLHVDLNALPGYLNLSLPPGPGPEALQGYLGHMVVSQDSEDGRRGDVNPMISLQEEADSHSTVFPFTADLQDEGFNGGWSSEGADLGPPLPIAKAVGAGEPMTFFPYVELTTGYAEVATGLGDVPCDLLVVLEDPETSLDYPLVGGDRVTLRHPGPPSMMNEPPAHF